MVTKSVVRLLVLLLSFSAALAQQQPKIRTVTAFIRLDRQNYRQQITNTLAMLRAAKAEFTKAGYEVETIRITSQPFPEIIRGLSAQQALDFFREYDKLAEQEGFTPDIGPAMTKDSDDAAQADLLAQIIAGTQSINGFIVVADDAGIHWNAVRAAARVNKYLEEHTGHSEGNFRFASGAFPPAIAPFYPVSYTSGPGKQFAVGMESANIAQEVFSGTVKDFSAATDQLAAAVGGGTACRPARVGALGPLGPDEAGDESGLRATGKESRHEDHADGRRTAWSYRVGVDEARCARGFASQLLESASLRLGANRHLVPI